MIGLAAAEWCTFSLVTAVTPRGSRTARPAARGGAKRRGRHESD